MNHHYYVTPEEYDIAQANGIKPKLALQRMRVSGWTKEQAINIPPMKPRESGKLGYKRAAEILGADPIKAFWGRSASGKF